MTRITNNFIGGLDSDTSPCFSDNKHYYYAENLRIVVDESRTSLALTNGLGLTATFGFPKNIYTTHSIKGAIIAGDYLIMFIRVVGSVSGKIYKIPLSYVESSTYRDVTQVSAYLFKTANFDFSEDNIFSMVVSNELSNVIKVYFADGKNPIRYINIFDDPSTLTLDDMNLFKNMTLQDPSFFRISSGSLNSGTYKYVYQLYDPFGTESSVSSESMAIPIYGASIGGTNLVVSGDASGVKTDKGIQITIPTIVTKFSHVRVISMYYSSETSVPECKYIYDGEYVGGLVINDDGNSNYGVISFEEVITDKNIIIPQTLETKFNYLFAGNITENFFDVDYDARAYRFSNKNGSITSEMFNENDLSDFTTVTSSNWGTVPEEYKVEWWKNFISNDEYVDATPMYNQKYMANGSTIGGEGPNISYTFHIKNTVLSDITFSDSVGGQYYYTNTASVNGIGDASLPNNYNSVGYQRDEIYRFGIVFYNSSGQKSFVKWIGDVRFPNEIEYKLISISGNYIYGKNIGIKFTIKNFPAGTSHYQIVRCKRDYNNSTVVDTGYVGHFWEETDSQNDYKTLFVGESGKNISPGPISAIDNRPALSSSATTKSILDYICPETNYNKNNNINYSRIDLYGGSTEVAWKLYNKFDKANASIVRLTPSIFVTTREVKNVSGTYLYQYNSNLNYVAQLPSSFGGYRAAARSRYSNSHYRALRGTGLMLKTSTDVDGDYKIKYAYRRNNIYPYGGYTSSAINSSEYISCSPITSISSPVLSIMDGDTFISVFEYMRIMTPEVNDASDVGWENRYTQCVHAIVESRLNLGLTVNKKLSYFDDGHVSSYTENMHNGASGITKAFAMKEKSGVYGWGLNTYFIQDFDLYQYNSAYSANLYQKKYYPKPSNWNAQKEYPCRVYRSDKKVNGESIDSWSKFYSNNFIDLDGRYGDITKLYNFRNILYCFQPDAISVLPIEDRELVQTNNTASLSVGTGGVLTRYDYIQTNSGATSANSVCSSTSYMYYIDNNRRKLCRLSNVVESISDSKRIMSLLKGVPTFNISCSIFNQKLNEIWFCLEKGRTIIYNENIDSFSSIVSSSINGSFNYKYNTYAYTNDGANSCSISSLDTGNYGGYDNTTSELTNNTDGKFPSKIGVLRFNINSNSDTNVRFDVLNFESKVLGTNGLSIPEKSFSTISLLNSYQISSNIQFQTDAINRFGVWRLNKIRDLYGNRMFDKYMGVELTYSNTEKLIVNNVHTDLVPAILR